ncbi:hypothetical protein FACS1894187_22940 [Synergistales bacterium]|nr:hypothetical protein FACS1894187_22940 [Synergistales bacterium]
MFKKVMSRKVLAVLLLASAAFVLATGAEAAKQSYGPLTVDLPDGWNAQEADDQIVFTAPDNSAALTIGVAAIEGESLENIAKGLAQALGGGTPQKVEGGYAFSFKNENGVDCFMSIVGDEAQGFYMGIMQTGNHPQMKGLMDSIEFSDE